MLGQNGQNKKSLSSFYAKKVTSLCEKSLAAKEKKIVENLNSLKIWEHLQKNLAGYQALSDEANLEQFYKDFSNKTKKPIAFPVTRPQGLTFYKCSYEQGKKSNFIKASFSILEPDTKQNEQLCLEDIGVFLIPGRAFDRRGCRLGRGKGYYDKTLATNKTSLKIGVCFSDQISDEDLPWQDHDVFMDIIVTDKFVLIPQGSSPVIKSFLQRI